MNQDGYATSGKSCLKSIGSGFRIISSFALAGDRQQLALEAVALFGKLVAS